MAADEDLRRRLDVARGVVLTDLGEEPAAVLHVGVVGLVVAEETPDGRELADDFRCVDFYRDGEGRIGGRGGADGWHREDNRERNDDAITESHRRPALSAGCAAPSPSWPGA